MLEKFRTDVKRIIIIHTRSPIESLSDKICARSSNIYKICMYNNMRPTGFFIYFSKKKTGLSEKTTTTTA